MHCSQTFLIDTKKLSLERSTESLHGRRSTGLHPTHGCHPSLLASRAPGTLSATHRRTYLRGTPLTLRFVRLACVLAALQGLDSCNARAIPPQANAHASVSSSQNDRSRVSVACGAFFAHVVGTISQKILGRLCLGHDSRRCGLESGSHSRMRERDVIVIEPSTVAKIRMCTFNKRKSDTLGLISVFPFRPCPQTPVCTPHPRSPLVVVKGDEEEPDFSMVGSGLLGGSNYVPAT